MPNRLKRFARTGGMLVALGLAGPARSDGAPDARAILDRVTTT